MSRAFVKEQDNESLDELPERPQSPHPNYVTPTGLAALQAQLHALQEQRHHLLEHPDEDLLSKETLKQVERDLRYFQGRVDHAILVDLSTQPADEVGFGAVVRCVDEDDQEHEFAIVGEDEADVSAGKISWVSPLAKALIGAGVGDTVVWKRPAGDLELEILSIRYPESQSHS